MSQHGDPPKQVASPDRPKEALTAAVTDFAANVISDQRPLLRGAGRSGYIGNMLVLASIVTAAIAGTTAIPNSQSVALGCRWCGVHSGADPTDQRV